MAAHPYPVRVDATLDEPGPSRWLWLVKWVLVIPHVLVLSVLWAVFVVLSVVALVAIVVTGRYPRAVFDVNVGILRWTWRVAFYAAGGFGTDRYPPFSLDDRPDYPAHLEVAYPDELSRGLVLVKWWLLAIPHYLVLGFLVGGGAVAVGSSADRGWGWSGGLVSLLAVVAGVVLLVTGRYPRPVFDLVLGLDRWVLRVAAYAALMTDEYPPFRLDQGGADPGTLALRDGAPANPAPAPVPAAAPAAAPAPSRPRWGAGRIVTLVVAGTAALTGLGALVGAAGLALVDHGLRDPDGYVMSDPVEVEAPGYAVLTEDLRLHGDGWVADLPERVLGEVRVEARDLGDHATFIGIADSRDVDRYLAGVARSLVVDAGDGQELPAYDVTASGAPAGPPGAQDFWSASASGTGTRSLTWEPVQGDWTLVVMTADAARPVRADVAVGATLPAVDDLTVALCVAALVLLGAAGVAAALALPRSRP